MTTPTKAPEVPATALERTETHLRAAAGAAFRRVDLDLGSADGALTLDERIRIDATLEDGFRALERADKLQTFRVTSEPDVYPLGGVHSFFRDLSAAGPGRVGSDPTARARLDAHTQQMRATNTSSFAGLIVPQYLTDLFLPAARAGRGIASAVMQVPLPEEGEFLDLVQPTTGAVAAVQASENTATNVVNVANSLLQVPVVTIAGRVDVSFQAIDRGKGSADVAIFADLLDAYNTALASQVISGTGTSGQMLGLLNTSGFNAITYTQATPTAATFMAVLGTALNAITTNRGRRGTVIAMHPRRWYSLTATSDTTNRPVALPSAAHDDVFPTASPDVIATLAGLGCAVVLDPNIPTNLGGGSNQDVVIVYRAADVLLAESPVNQVVVKQQGVATLTASLELYRFAAFTSQRVPTAVSIISGTGLVTPSNI